MIGAGIAAACVIVVFVITTVLPAQHYNNGESALGKGDYKQAISEFGAAGTYKDASDKKTVAERDQKISNCENFTMGMWRGKPIEWKVLEVTDGKALVISNDILTVRQYDSLKSQLDGKLSTDPSIDWSNIKMTWADSEIRAWLNGDFLNGAFSKSEQDSILTSKISNPDNTVYGTPGDADTKDKVFLLSLDEVNKYFAGGKMYDGIKDGISYRNDDLIEKYAFTSEDENYTLHIEEYDWGWNMKDYWSDDHLGQENPMWWWLRSPGYEGADGINAASISTDGEVSVYGNGVGNEESIGGVRPAMYLDLPHGANMGASASNPVVPTEGDGSITVSPYEEKSIMIGTWQDGPSIASQYGQRYHFYDDGSYLYEDSNYANEDRTISESGTWSIANETLTLSVNSKVTIEGGERVKNELPDDPSIYSIANGEIKVIKMSLPEKKEYTLTDFSFDGRVGHYAFEIKGVQWWRLSDNPDVYHNDFVVKDGDVWNPES